MFLERDIKKREKKQETMNEVNEFARRRVMLWASILNPRLTHSCSSPEGICTAFAQQKEREKEGK